VESHQNAYTVMALFPKRAVSADSSDGENRRKEKKILMVKKMLINACHSEECRVVVVADGLLEELDVEVNTREATLGNIYKGAITRVEPSLQAVFVDYGASRNGFLSINDVHPSYFPESFEAARRRPRVQDVFKKDDHVIVQVNKEERSNKGASLTTNISLAGRYLVLMPGTDLCGVSRKIEDEKERKKLKELLTQLKLPENIGFIIRTAGMGRTKTELARDLDYLLKLWQCIEKDVADKPAPAILHREHDIVIRAIREHFSSDICEILVDDKEVYRKVRDFFHQVMPKYEPQVKQYQEKRPLFNKYQLEEQIEQVYSKRIKLKSGGHIVIEPTEAMVTIDVNSGSATKEKGIEDTAFRVNMEAAPEVARQLRLRDLGGIIVVDFIDMTQKKHKQDVEKEIKAALKLDRAKTKILRISALGLLELSRQRLKSSLGTGEYHDCPMCEGAGKIRSPETAALSVFRRVKSFLIRPDVTEVRVVVPAKIAEYLLNNMRGQLVELEMNYHARVVVQVGHGISDSDIIVEALKEEPVEAPVELVAPQVTAVAPEVRETVVVPESEAEVVGIEAEAEADPEAEKKKAKKPSRRRRRSRKKTTQGPEEEALMGDAQPEVALEEASDRDAAMDEPRPAEDESVSVAVEEIEAEAFMLADLSASVALTESEPLVVPESQEEEAEKAESAAAGSARDSAAYVGEEQEKASEEPVAAAEETLPADQAKDRGPAEDPGSAARENNKPAPRKSLLQSYLPFS
jgi:ribonuclease E